MDDLNTIERAWKVISRKQYGVDGPSACQRALLSFPMHGFIHASVHMRWKVWKQADLGLVEGVIGHSGLTALGRELRTQAQRREG